MEKYLSTFYDGNPSQSSITKFIQSIMKFIRVLMPLCKEHKHQRFWAIPRFKTSAGLESDISSACTVANGNE